MTKFIILFMFVIVFFAFNETQQLSAASLDILEILTLFLKI